MMSESLMANTLSNMKIGFAGLGNMGMPMTRHLHETGAEVIVWNRSEGPAEAAAAHGMRRAKSLPELAEHVGDGQLELRRGAGRLGVLRDARVADPRQHVCNRIGHHGFGPTA